MQEQRLTSATKASTQSGFPGVFEAGAKVTVEVEGSGFEEDFGAGR